MTRLASSEWRGLVADRLRYWAFRLDPSAEAARRLREDAQNYARLLIANGHCPCHLVRDCPDDR